VRTDQGFPEDVDLGFAFLPEFRKQGYAYESASATLAYGKSAFGLKRIVAIASPDNSRSTLLLEKLGMKFLKKVKLAQDDDDVSLYAFDGDAGFTDENDDP
jgi:RimJ/RimL family protein N-acetyltransferase